MTPQKTFYHLLANTILSSFGNTFLWFCLVFWAYLETRSVMVTSIIGGMYLIAVLCSGVFFGAFVDHHKKKTAMVVSNFLSFCFYLLAAGILFAFPLEIFSDKKEPLLSLSKKPKNFFFGFLLLKDILSFKTEKPNFHKK